MSTDVECIAQYEALCAPASAFYGMFGASAALFLANMGAAYGTAKAGIAVAHLGISEPGKAMKGIVPVVMAGILGIYGLIIAIIICGGVGDGSKYSNFQGFLHLAAGLGGGFASVAAGYVIGILGDACCFAYRYTDRIFVAMVLMLIFAEALGLYGLIVALLMNSTASGGAKVCENLAATCEAAKRW